MENIVDLSGLKQAVEGIGEQISTAINIDKVRKEIPHQNLLDNWYFPSPVNQKGEKSYRFTSVGYGIDRWECRTYAQTYLTDAGFQFYSYNPNEQKRVWARQWIDRFDIYNKTITLSALYEGKLLTVTGVVKPEEGAGFMNTDGRIEIAIDSARNDGYPAFIMWSEDGPVTVEAVKLEFGDHQTLARQDSNGVWVLNDTPPDPVLELIKCQRYMVVMDTFKRSGYARFGTAVARSATLAYAICNMPVAMRTVPTLQYSGKFVLLNDSWHDVSKVELVEPSDCNMNLHITSSGLTSGAAYQFLASADHPTLIFDANL